MPGVYRMLVQLVADEEGQDLVEYSLLIALIAFAAVAAVQSVTHEINHIFHSLTQTFDSSLKP